MQHQVMRLIALFSTCGASVCLRKLVRNAVCFGGCMADPAWHVCSGLCSASYKQLLFPLMLWVHKAGSI